MPKRSLLILFRLGNEAHLAQSGDAFAKITRHSHSFALYLNRRISPLQWPRTTNNQRISD